MLGFLAGFLVNSILSAFVAPVTKPLEELMPYLLCPNSFFCSTHQEFAADTAVQCETGDVGALVRQAIADGDLDDRRDEDGSSLATRAFLCADESWGKKKSSEHLQSLAVAHNACFEYTPKKSKHDEFSVRVGLKSHACISNIGKNPSTGMLGHTHDGKGRVFCFANTAVPNGEYSPNIGLRRCTKAELEAIGMPEHLLPNKS